MKNKISFAKCLYVNGNARPWYMFYSTRKIMYVKYIKNFNKNLKHFFLDLKRILFYLNQYFVNFKIVSKSSTILHSIVQVVVVYTFCTPDAESVVM